MDTSFPIKMDTYYPLFKSPEQKTKTFESRNVKTIRKIRWLQVVPKIWHAHCSLDKQELTPSEAFLLERLYRYSSSPAKIGGRSRMISFSALFLDSGSRPTPYRLRGRLVGSPGMTVLSNCDTPPRGLQLGEPTPRRGEGEGGGGEENKK